LQLAVDVTHARKISQNEMLILNAGIESVTGDEPGFLISGRNGLPSSSRHFRPCQAAEMSGTEFSPTPDSARRILACVDDRSRKDTIYFMTGVLSLGFVGLGGTFLRDGLAASLEEGERSLLRRQQAQEIAPLVQTIAAPVQSAGIEAVISAGISDSMTVRKPLRLKPAKMI
jgi:hypothetical protein